MLLSTSKTKPSQRYVSLYFSDCCVVSSFFMCGFVLFMSDNLVEKILQRNTKRR